MTLLENAGADFVSWIPAILFGLITLYITSYFLAIRRYPAGPLPLPIIGNVLLFRVKGRPIEVVNELRKKYGDIFTLWLGNMPMVFVCNYELTRKAVMESKNDFSGRISTVSVNLFIRGRQSIIFSDYGPRWELLRKIGHAAIRKYAVSERLATLIGDVADETAQNMMKEQDYFDPKDHVYNMFFNIIASSLFGQRYHTNDEELEKFKQMHHTIEQQVASGFPSDFSPLLRPFYIRREIILKNRTEDAMKTMVAKMQEHLKTYQADDIRDVTDSLIAARTEIEGTEKVSYIDDLNLAQILLDVMLAGIDTSQATTRWVINYMANYPDIQEKAIAEIREQIGDRLPVQNDRLNCPYLSAVIMETLRLRPPAPWSVPHKTTCDTELGGQHLCKDTPVMFILEASHMDSFTWTEPTEFRPERFLEENQIVPSTRLSGYIPFGQGRRSCIGEKLALNDLFLVLARFLQNGHFVAEAKPGKLDLEPIQMALGNFPKENKMRFICHERK